jgi:hypothetical protein
VQGEFVDALPLVLWLLAPDEDATVVGGGGEDGAILRVSPGNAPDSAFVSIASIRKRYSRVGEWLALLTL